MKISVRTSGEGLSKTYTLVIVDKHSTLNIDVTGGDPSHAMRNTIDRVKSGSTEVIGCITFIPVGEYVVLTLTTAGISSRYISKISDLKFI